MEILLVEDNADDLELTLHVFRRHHVTNSVRVARDGAEALALIFSNGENGQDGILNYPKIILLDLMLPKVDGLEVLQRLKADDRTRSIPVVVLTSSHQEKDIIRSYALGVIGYIIKPVNFQQFSNAVCELGLYWNVLSEPPALVAAVAEMPG